VQWLTASPFWEGLSTAPNRSQVLKQPTLLRFANDTFMEEFLAVATTTPERLKDWQARQETWRRPLASPPGTGPVDLELAGQPLKLYQPAHQRFYLVTANLVCRIPGLPDKTLNLGRGERVGFVLRRKMQDSKDNQLKEHALVNGAWQPLTTGQIYQLITGEQTFPMFPVTYSEADGYQRRMFAGLVPVSGREAYMNAMRQAPTGSSSINSLAIEEKIQQLLTVLAMDVIEPWQNIIRLWEREKASIVESWDKNADRAALHETVDKIRDKLQVASWYVLLDFANFLKNYLPTIWARIESSPDGSIPAGSDDKALIETLQSATFIPKVDTSGNNVIEIFLDKLQGKLSGDGISLSKALKEIYQAQQQLETATAEYQEGSSGWPTTKFLLCCRTLISEPTPPRKPYLEELKEAVKSALIESLQKSSPALIAPIPLIPSAQAISFTTQSSDYTNDNFTIRCVYERPNCPPSIRPTVVSEASEVFQMASYYDPDAPARPIRIPLPVDTTPAGLRKFAKNTMFIMSDTLACQVGRARSLSFGDLVRSVLPWPFHKDLPDSNVAGCESGAGTFGMICTLSIPIITLCALILLIIIVFLLDVIFKWVPYLIFCLPLPGLKAKKGKTP
jgi:hypothetical protein